MRFPAVFCDLIVTQFTGTDSSDFCKMVTVKAEGGWTDMGQ